MFDLDGTLVQTEKLKARSYAEAAQHLNPDLKIEAVLEAFKAVVGRSRQEVAEFLLDAFDLSDSAAQWMEAYQVRSPWQSYVQIRMSIYEGLLLNEDVILEHRWPSALALLDLVRGRCERVGLATMSHAPQAARVLSVLQLTDAFDFVATRDDVERGKPDPEIYTLVLRELNVRPDRGLAIEDSPSGVRAGLAAGMDVIAVATDFTRAALRAASDIPQDRIVEDPTTLLATVERVLKEKQHG